MNKRYIVFSFLLLSTTIMTMEHEVKKTHVTLEQVKSMCAGIHKLVQCDNFKPDLLVGIARGGLIPLSLLAGESMFNNRNVVTISTESYDDANQRKELKLRFPVHAEDFQNFQSILVVDDIADTGETLDFVAKLIKEYVPKAAIKCAVLYYKPKSKIVPEYYIEETASWIVFPWEE